MPRRVGVSSTVTLSTFETLRAEIAAAARLRHRALARPRQLSVRAETSSSSEDLIRRSDAQRKSCGGFCGEMMMMMMMMMMCRVFLSTKGKDHIKSP